MDFAKQYNRDSWLEFLEDSFLPDDFRIGEKEISYSGDYTREVTRLGECPSLKLTVFEIKHSSVNDARVGLSREAFKLVRETKYSRALILFVPQNTTDFYRSSLVEYTPEVDEKGKIERVRSNPRRYSYLLGKGCKNHTPTKYLIGEGPIREQTRKGKKYSAIEDLNYRFSVEVLTKEFYDKLFGWYEWALSIVRFPEGRNRKVQLTDTDNEMHLIRLITRFIFVWFIKQKKLVDEWLFEKDKISAILKNFKPDSDNPDSDNSGDYYNGILQNLFFATLNKEINERRFTKDKKKYGNKEFGIKSFYRDRNGDSYFKITTDEVQEKFSRIPFLNGGLFECLDKTFDNPKKPGNSVQEYHDGFSREKCCCASVPDKLFFGKGDNGKHEGLINLFNQYNFTVEENTPVDVDVALDPELLGKVFENLLGTYNDKTRTPARNESGSFYTPREIIDYMAVESLKAHLCESETIKENKDKKAPSDIIDKLFSYTDEIPELGVEERRNLIKMIDTCRILDPACGSGAFPMGVLNKLSLALSKLDTDGKLWKERQEERAKEMATEAFTIDNQNDRDAKLKEISDTFEFNKTQYGHKLYLIENSLFGVDIQSIAIQITKLRFFISLIVEQDRDESKSNYGIRALPNLETKFVCANTLIGLSEQNKELLGLEEDDNVQIMKEKLWNIRENHFYAQTSKRKSDLRKDDKNKRDEIKQYLLDTAVKPNAELIKKNNIQITDLELKRKMVENEKLVDVSKDNAHLFDNLNDGLPQYIDANAEKRSQIDAEIKRLRNQNDKEKNKSVNTSIHTDILRIADWDPYDQDAKAAKFFDSYWMFGIKDGFDVVMGNPPYVSTKGVSEEDKELFIKYYGFSDDTYTHFFFRGFQLLNTKGILSFISPKTFWTTQTKRNLRDLILSKNILYIFDTANPFKAAMVDTCITTVQNCDIKNNKFIFLDGSKDLNDPRSYTVPLSIYRNTQNSVIFKPTIENIKIQEMYGQKVKELYDKWWDKISTSKNIENNKNELEEYRKNLKPGDIALLGCLTEGGQGLATANNGKYIAVRKSSKWAKNIYESRPKKLDDAIRIHKIKIPELKNFTNTMEYLKSLSEKEIALLFDNLKEKYGRDIFGQGYLYKLIEDNEIADVDKLTAIEKANGISTSKKYYVPYDKGDKDGNRWYLDTPFAIAWSKENVQFLKTNSGKKGEGMPVFRNPQYYFKEGFCWTFILNENSEYQKARIKLPTVNDVNAMALYPVDNIVSIKYLVCLFNSFLVYSYKHIFINNTSSFQINDARQIPIIVPTKEDLKQYEDLFSYAVDIKKNQYSNKISLEMAESELSAIQEKLDKMTLKLYKII